MPRCLLQHRHADQGLRCSKLYVTFSHFTSGIANVILDGANDDANELACICNAENSKTQIPLCEACVTQHDDDGPDNGMFSPWPILFHITLAYAHTQTSTNSSANAASTTQHTTRPRLHPLTTRPCLHPSPPPHRATVPQPHRSSRQPPRLLQATGPVLLQLPPPPRATAPPPRLLLPPRHRLATERARLLLRLLLLCLRVAMEVEMERVETER